MRTTITLDDDLLAAASEAIGVSERGVVLREGLKALIEREAARRLARLGGTDPTASVAPRRRPAADASEPAAPARRAAPRAR